MSGATVALEVDVGEKTKATPVLPGGRAPLIPLVLASDRYMAYAAEIVGGALADAQRTKSVVDG